MTTVKKVVILREEDRVMRSKKSRKNKRRNISGEVREREWWRQSKGIMSAGRVNNLILNKDYAPSKAGRAAAKEAGMLLEGEDFEKVKTQNTKIRNKKIT